MAPSAVSAIFLRLAFSLCVPFIQIPPPAKGPSCSSIFVQVNSRNLTSICRPALHLHFPSIQPIPDIVESWSARERRRGRLSKLYPSHYTRKSPARRRSPPRRPEPVILAEICDVEGGKATGFMRRGFLNCLHDFIEQPSAERMVISKEFILPLWRHYQFPVPYPSATRQPSPFCLRAITRMACEKRGEQFARGSNSF